jgi:hypothetical protein
MKNLKLLILLVSIFTFISCESFVEGVNNNPNDFTSASGALIIGHVEMASVFMAESQPSRLAGIFTNQFTGSDRQFITYDSYNMVSGDFDDVWNKIYVDGIAQSRLVQSQSKSNLKLFGVAQLFEAYFAGEGTALFGDIPFKEASNSTEFPNPKYDTQAEVLNNVQTLLDEAIKNIGSSKVSDFYGKPVFVTNNANWLEIANTLKARYYLIAKNYAKAAEFASKGISSVNGDLLANHSSLDGQRNLFYQFGIEQRGGYLTVEDSYMKKLMTGARARSLVTPGDEVRASDFFDGSELNYDTGYFGVDKPFPIVSWIENRLILAEAQSRQGNTEAAQIGLNSVRSYLASYYKAEFPASNATGSVLLRHILEEKYISLIGSLQVFHDTRRTQNLLRIPVKNGSSIPQRFLYPQIEINTNKNFPGVKSLFTPTPINN